MITTTKERIAIHRSLAELLTRSALTPGNRFAAEHERMAAEHLGMADEAQAEAAVIEFLQRYVGKGKSPMCGNSICQDRRFMANGMPKLEAYFHYRNLDVSTLKELAKRWKPSIADGFKKHQKHTALADIHESIDELAYYREHLLSL